MSVTLIQITDKEFNSIIENAFRQGAKIAKAEIEKRHIDKITEEEAIKEFGYNKRKLASLRADRLIIYYADKKPYSYSRKSLKAYQESMMVG
ncbi:MAG: hypothetical protein QM493_10465 [Sulfurovum sp.]